MSDVLPGVMANEPKFFKKLWVLTYKQAIDNGYSEDNARKFAWVMVSEAKRQQPARRAAS